MYSYNQNQLGFDPLTLTAGIGAIGQLANMATQFQTVNNQKALEKEKTKQAFITMLATPKPAPAPRPTVYQAPPPPMSTATGKDNTLLYVGGGAAALILVYFMMNKK